MAKLFATGAVIDIIVCAMLLELLVLILARGRARRGLPVAELMANLGAGAALLMALRAALLGSPWQRIAVWLAVALGMHAADLGLRWTRHTRVIPSENLLKQR
jgi:CBS-domain-containing membrane protein